MNLRQLACLTLAALGCSSSGPTVIVDVVTDFSPGSEFQAVRTRIIDGPERVTPAMACESEQYLRARRIASFDSGLSAGEITVRVELLRPDGSVLAGQSRTGTLTNILSVTAVFTRNCQGVRCNAGEACIDETCVDESCNPTNPASCPDAVLCQDAEDCIRPGLAACASTSCIQFLCLVESDGSACGSEFYCNPESGCIPRSSSGDGGGDAGGDAGCVGDACTSDCVAGAPCETGNACEIGMLDCSGAMAACVATDRPDGTMCGATTCGDFGACGGFSDRCDLGGTQSRTCADTLCVAGSCGSVNRDENQGCTRTLSETCGDLIDTDCDGTCDEGCRVAIHRGVRGNDHFYTRSRAELDGAGYGYEGVAFYVYPNPNPGLLPLLRCRNGGDHFVSLSSNCEGTAIEGTLGYARHPTQPSCGSVVLYRLFWAGGPDHFVTTSSAERSANIPPYASEDNAAHVWRTP